MSVCERCGLPSATELGLGGCFGGLAESGDLACRDRELADTQRALASAKALIAHARVLLLRTRDALDLALAETEPDEPGADGG